MYSVESGNVGEESVEGVCRARIRPTMGDHQHDRMTLDFCCKEREKVERVRIR